MPARTAFLLLLLARQLTGYTQTAYWQQEVNYTIQVSLNDQLNSLKGDMSLLYTNNSPDTLTYIWFHLWPNAYKNDQTALARQLARDKESGEKIKDKTIGYIDSLAFTINGKIVTTETDTANIDMVKLVLPQPLLPGNRLTIATPFYVQLPNYYSRSGYSKQQYMVCQWYPKPAVYDRKGWHAFPYLDQGEFYSEYGTFNVSITVPAEYVVGATGSLQTKDELVMYKELGAKNNQSNRETNYKVERGKKNTTKTLQYYGEQVHDFAWFAGKEYIIRHDTLQLSDGKIIDVFSYGQPNGNKRWKNSTDYIKDAVRRYSGWVGEYPYPTVQAVEGPKNLSSGGMEYPMITLITSPGAGELELDGVITHEVGHNWFYGILGSNERDYPWMDEGINTYLQFRYEAEKYRSNALFGSSIPKDVKKLPPEEFLARIYNGLNRLPAKQAVNTSSTGFANKDDYGIVVYIKTAVWLYLVETAIGRDNLDKGLQEYFSAWKFRHPYPEDFKAALEKASGKNLDDLWALLDKEDNF